MTEPSGCNYGGWSTWRDYGGNFAYSPAAISKDGGRSVDLFVTGTNQRLYHKWWKSSDANNSSGGWSAWHDYGGSFSSSPAAISKDGGSSIDLFVTGTDQHLYYKWWNSADWNSPTGGWSAWTNLDGLLTSPPAVVSSSGYSVDVFVRGATPGLFRREAVVGSGWRPWVLISGQ